MKRLSKLALVLLACFALVATGCKQDSDVDNNGTNTSQSGSGSGTESGGGSESGDGTQTGGDNTGDQTGGDTEKGDGSQESGGDTEKGDTGSGETGGSTGGETGGQTETVAVGDIILQDLTIVSSEGYTKNDSNPPVAVVAGFNKDGAVIGLGLEKSSGLKWAASGTTGCNTNFTEIAATVTGDNTAGYEFTDNTDGSNNWTEICNADDTASANAAKNYPAFNFANTYGTTQGYTGDLASGWYIPSISELYEIYKNKETLQTSLTKVSGFTIDDKTWYWSSSQSSSNGIEAYDLNLKNGTVELSSRYSGLSVLVVRAF